MAIISASKKTGFRGYGNTQFRYAMTYVVVTLVVLFFLNIYCSGVSHKLFYQSKEASMIEKCLLASDEISTLEVLNSSTVTGIVNQLESLKVTRLVVTDHSGAALYDSSGASVGTYVLLPEILQALTVSKQAPEGNNVFTWTYHDGITDSRAATPIVYYGTVVGCVYMTEYDTTQGTLIKSLQQTLFRITLMLEIIVAAFSVAFSNAFSRRLNRIMTSMRIIREGDYSHKVDMGGSDELTVLGEEFNDLTERLQTSERKRSQFVSDASHELKTPLASIKLLTDSILQNSMDMDTVKEFVEDIGNEADRLNRMTAKLLSLTKAEKSPATGKRDHLYGAHGAAGGENAPDERQLVGRDLLLRAGRGHPRPDSGGRPVPDRFQPDGKRHQVQPARRNTDGASWPSGGQCGTHRQRHGHGNSRGRAGAHFRAVLPGG